MRIIWQDSDVKRDNGSTENDRNARSATAHATQSINSGG